jgi:hypothetical protein
MARSKFCCVWCSCSDSNTRFPSSSHSSRNLYLLISTPFPSLPESVWQHCRVVVSVSSIGSSNESLTSAKSCRTRGDRPTSFRSRYRLLSTEYRWHIGQRINASDCRQRCSKKKSQDGACECGARTHAAQRPGLGDYGWTSGITGPPPADADAVAVGSLDCDPSAFGSALPNAT